MTEKETKKELERLANLFHERKQEFAKASRIRWLLTFVGFTLFYFIVIMILQRNFNIVDVIESGLGNIAVAMLIASLFSLGHFYVNVSIFGWLFQKDIAEGKRLDAIMKQIQDIEKDIQ